jgi:hypothetical protein
MIRRAVAVSMLGFLLATGALLALLTYFQSSSLAGDFRQKTWFALVNLNNNGYHSWRLDHLTRLASLLSPNFNFAERPVPGMILLLIGTYIFLRRCSVQRPTSIIVLWAGAALAVSFIVFVTGLDPVVVGSVAWVPFVAIAAHIAMTSTQGYLPLIGLLIVSIEAAFSANLASLPSVATAVWLAYLLSLSLPGSSQRRAITWSLALAPALLATVTAPMPELPHYPKSAHVLPFEGNFGTLRPLLGPTYPFDTLDRAAVRAEYGDRAFTLLVLAIIAWWFRRRHNTAVARYTGKVGMVLALLASLNTCFTESLSAISPLPSLSRMIPWGTCYSITSVALGLGAWMTVTSLVLNLKTISLVPLACSVALLSVVGSPNIYSPMLRRVGIVENETLRPFILSPSAAIFRSLAASEGDITKQLETIRDSSRLPSRDVRSLNAVVEMHPISSQSQVSQGGPADDAWRWSTRTGSQRGDELLIVRFSSPVEIRGVELDPGRYFTDYPRGLRIAGGSCDQTAAVILAEHPTWQGALRVLSRGIPYYSPRNDVRVIFKNPATVSCLFIYQTGHAQFDWSISRIRVL